ncbi:unnamed protein product [Mytilus edulis]|uniref:Uncharacterized protein n=1 Tax=Mytilus edulis TaxID=6550 RepID=A0A8S3UPI4_MYTED|nr:unnamed protein product [Mytilus edulis]
MAKITHCSRLFQGILFLSSLHFLLCGNFCSRQKIYQYGTKSCPGCSNTKLYSEIHCCDKWKGYTCDVPICDPPCYDGKTCYGPDSCRCSNQTVGGVCSSHGCFPPCQHGGECYGLNKCSCRPGYAGDFCDVNPSDIIFVVDESGSVGHDDFRVTMEYLANAVNRLPIRYDLLRIGLALFSGSTRKSFKLDDHFTKEHVTDAILNTYFGSGGTNIDGALGYTCEDMFQLTTGDRPYAQNILVLITDGQSSSANKPGLQKCKSKNVTIIGIGIGSSVDEQQLRSLVSKPEYYFDTTYDNLDTTLPKLIKTITDFCPPGCKNGGTCISREKCQCPDGYAGLLCETKVTCIPECQNNGTCHNTNQCRCLVGYKGDICDILEFCRPGCQNGGTCIAKGKCLCPEGYAGNHCQNRERSATEYDIITTVLNGYNKLVRPIDPVNNVTHSLIPKETLVFNPKTLVFKAMQCVSWNDPRLSWPRGQPRISLPSSVIWLPDIVMLGQEIDHDFEAKAIIMKNGDVTYCPQNEIKSTNCEEKSGSVWECNFKFLSWSYDKVMLDIHFPSVLTRPSIDMSIYYEHDEYEIVSQCAVRREMSYPCRVGTYPELTYTFVIRRRRSFCRNLNASPTCN